MPQDLRARSAVCWGQFTASIPLWGILIGQKGFAGAVSGGYGNMYGAIIGGMFFGFAETFISAYISTSYKDCISFGILIIILTLHAYRHSEVQSFGIGRPRRIRYDKYTKKKRLEKEKFSSLQSLIVVFGCMTAIAFGETYMALMFCRIGIYTIAVSGLDILFGYTGQISFGHAAFFAVGSYTSAYFSINMGWNPIFTMLIGVVFSMIVGAVIAIPATKLVKHFLSLLTIAFGQLVYTFANSTRPITGGASGLKDIPSISIFNFFFLIPMQKALFLYLSLLFF